MHKVKSSKKIQGKKSKMKKQMKTLHKVGIKTIDEIKPVFLKQSDELLKIDRQKTLEIKAQLYDELRTIIPVLLEILNSQNLMKNELEQIKEKLRKLVG